MAKRLWITVPAGTPARHCSSCKAEIYWVKTATGKLMPVDTSVANGTDPTACADGQGEAHFVTCPDANRWRKRR